jgi:hypothetical protein
MSRGENMKRSALKLEKQWWVNLGAFGDVKTEDAAIKLAKELGF